MRRALCALNVTTAPTMEWNPYKTVVATILHASTHPNDYKPRQVSDTYWSVITSSHPPLRLHLGQANRQHRCCHAAQQAEAAYIMMIML